MISVRPAHVGQSGACGLVAAPLVVVVFAPELEPVSLAKLVMRVVLD